MPIQIRDEDRRDDAPICSPPPKPDDTVRLLPDAPVPEMELSCRGRTGRVASVTDNGAMVIVFQGTGTVGPGCFAGGTVGPVRGDWVDREDEANGG